MNVPLRELHLFAGAGGGILGGLLCGHVPVCAVELEEYPRRVLLQRQRDGILPWFREAAEAEGLTYQDALREAALAWGMLHHPNRKSPSPEEKPPKR